MKKVYTVSIIGCGSRGCGTYGDMMQKCPDMYKVVSLCDINVAKADRYAENYGIDKQNVFYDEQAFFAQKRSDVLVIGTQDRDHVRMCIRALELGYDVLLEKPISPVEEELHALLKANEKYQRKVIVCHVLRYAPAFVKVKELLDEGTIGKLVMIQAAENVAFWHQAHSFVRGNWRNDSQTSPMIMQKCCHDLDLLQYYVGARCESVYSVGNLSFFKAENKPEGAADRCAECKYKDSCAYSAEKLYVERWKKAGEPKNSWPYNVVDFSRPITEETLRKGYESGDYGRCVFACDNNVVDNQNVSMRFENGVQANLTMTAFTYRTGRRMIFYGTHGEIELNDIDDMLRISPFGGEQKVLPISKMIAESRNNSFGHGGGDYGMLDSLYQALEGNATAATSLEGSVESHLIALAAEKSRKQGAPIKIHE